MDSRSARRSDSGGARRYFFSFARLLSFCVVVFLGSPLSANASPPAVDQYVEQLPSPGGERPAGLGGNSPEGLPESRSLALFGSLGDKGRRAALVLGKLDLGDPSEGKETKSEGSGDGFSSIGEVLAVSDFGGSGLGFVLPLSLLAVLVIGLLLRYLNRTPETKGRSAGD